jgi:FtsH-binding integral membrane protein
VTDAVRPPRELKPLRMIGLGLLFSLTVVRDEWDVLPDWFGWLLILIASVVLTRGMTGRGPMLISATAAVVGSAVLWPPKWAAAVHDEDVALEWALRIPGLIWMVLFCLLAAHLSRREPQASVWWKYLAYMHIAVGIMSVLVYGGKLDSIEATMILFQVFGLLAAIVLAFWHSNRDWAVVPART